MLILYIPINQRLSFGIFLGACFLARSEFIDTHYGIHMKIKSSITLSKPIAIWLYKSQDDKKRIPNLVNKKK